MLKQRLLASVFLCATIAPVAHAQTDTTNLGTLSTTGAGNAAANTPGGGLLVNETSTKQVSTVTRTFIQTQAPSSNPFQLLQFEPSVNAQSIDSTGSVGGSLNVRGFDSSEMGFTIEGVPVNDSGNYAVYPQEYVDAENLDNIFLSQGSVDLNAPHVGASGGNIGISMIQPSDKAGGYVAQGYGTNNEHRSFLRLDSGLLPTGTKFYVSSSYEAEDKWRGLGEDQKYNTEAKLVQTLPHDSSITASFIYVWEDNYSYLALTKAQWQANKYADYDTSFGGATDTNYYKLHLNPFRNVITQITGNFGITENLHLTIQPYFWFGYGNGGGATDLNVDKANNDYNSFGPIPFKYPLPTAGDSISGTGTAEKLLTYDPSITNTYRPGIINTLTYQLGNQTLAGGYWLEITRHKQTGEYEPVGLNGVPGNIWATNGVLLLPNGTPAYRRDWLTGNTAQEFFLTDDGSWLNGKVETYAGIRTPNYKRTTDNEEYGVPAADVHLRRDYNDILPYVGASYNINSAQMVFLDFAGTFRAPQNYAFFDNPPNQQDQKPETAYTTELGYRYQTDKVILQADAYNTHFINREGSLGVDPIDGTATDRNIGATQDDGVEFNSGYQPKPGFSLHATASYDDSTLLDNISTTETGGGIGYVPSKGKQFPDTPKFQASAGADYEIWNGFSIGGTVKYVGVRYSTYVDDETTPAYYYTELHADYHLPHFGLLQDPTLQLNVLNMIDTNYLGVIYSQTLNAHTIGTGKTSIAGSSPTYDPGAPGSVTLTLSTPF
jgi:iron complex outermembrane receptor protein